MENGLDYQEIVRRAIRTASEPLPTLPFDSSSVFPLARRPGFRIPHSTRYVVDGMVVPPDDVRREIDACWTRNMETPNQDPRIKPKQQVPFSSKKELYRLWWVSGSLCNLSGVKGNWIENSPFKLCFDQKVPKSKGGDYLIGNLQIILSCENTAKWDYENGEAIEWMSGYKHYGGRDD